MKYILTVIAVLFTVSFTNAQIIKTIPKKLTPLKREMVSRTTAHRGYANVSVKAELIQTEGKGETINFTSNTAIDKVELSFVGVPNSKQITTYNADTKTGYFYLESGAYQGGQAKGYLLHFFVKGFDKPVWVVALTEKK
jgi:threonyl-tRNA synthetase